MTCCVYKTLDFSCESGNSMSQNKNQICVHWWCKCKRVGHRCFTVCLRLKLEKEKLSWFSLEQRSECWPKEILLRSCFSVVVQRDKKKRKVPCVSAIWTSVNWPWQIGINFKLISVNEQAFHKNIVHSKCFQKWLVNNHLVSLITLSGLCRPLTVADT